MPRADRKISPTRKPSVGALEGHLAQAIAAHRAGRFEEADSGYRQVLRAVPDHDQAVHLRADLAAQTGCWAEATELYRRLTVLRPSRPDHWQALGAAALRAGSVEDAVTACRTATVGAPGEPGVWNNLGVALHQAGNPRDALAAYDRAIAIAPSFAEAYANRGIALKVNGALDQAISAFDRAIALAPDHAAARHSRSLAALTLGRFETAWTDYLWRPGVDRARAPRPDGPLPARLDGRCLPVLRDQGLGDELFFLRFAAGLTARGATIAYEADPKIASLLARVPHLAQIMDGGQAAARAEPALSVGDLPYLLGPNTGTPPPLRLAATACCIARAERILAERGPRPWIGVTWRAGSKGPEKLDKAVPVVTLGQALRDCPGTIVAVQRNPDPGELAALAAAAGRPIADLTDWNEDLEAMLGLMERLDDYVCVSNTNLHLRAGCGKTCRVLIPHPAEFRWLNEGLESPWFPNFFLYRQLVDRNWGPAIEGLAAALHS